MSYIKELEEAYLIELLEQLDNPETCKDLMIELADSVVVTADYCVCEPDGKCIHNYSSPLLLLGLI